MSGSFFTRVGPRGVLGIRAFGTAGGSASAGAAAGQGYRDRSGVHPCTHSLPRPSMAAAATPPACHVFWGFQIVALIPASAGLAPVPGVVGIGGVATDPASRPTAGLRRAHLRRRRPGSSITFSRKPRSASDRSDELPAARGRRVLGVGRKWHRDVPRPEYGQDVRPRDAPRPQGTAAPSEADAPRPGSNTQVHGGSRIPRL